MSKPERGKSTIDQDNARLTEITTALHEAERKLSERDALINQAFDQTEAARAQYSQSVERAEALRRRLDAKDEQLQALQLQFDSKVLELKTATESVAELKSKTAELENELQQRNNRIAYLEEMCAENDNALEAIHSDMDRSDTGVNQAPVISMGYVLESLDAGVTHRISRTTTTLGRASTSDISIDSSSVSRYHARLVLEPDGLFLTDLKSTNGCRVNGKLITRRKLADGDAIMIGEARFRLTVQKVNATLISAEKPSFDDQQFTHTVVSIDKKDIPELPYRAKA
jgi:hypothetical protein